MSACVFNFVCATCGTKFFASGLSDFEYGTFVMRSLSGEEVYLEAISSPTYHEFRRLVRASPLLESFEDRKRTKVMQEAFTVACDPDRNGEKFTIGLQPTCPKCSSREMASWGPVSPPESSPIPPVLHTRWSRMTAEEKRKTVDIAIRRIIGLE